MMRSPTMMQNRIIRQFIRRNIRGWGRPLSYTLQRLRLSGIVGLIALILLVIDGWINGAQKALHPDGGSATFFALLILFAFAFTASSLWTYGIPYFRATQQPQETITGIVNATICNAKDFMPIAQDLSHFITLRLPDGRLRAFAINPDLHDQVCQSGKQVTLTVIPGIEQVVAVR